MAWTAPRTWVAAETVTAAIGNTHWRDNLKAIGDAWTSYTPTLTNWTLGNGTLTGRSMQAGKLVHAVAELTLGSTSTPSGTFAVSLPVATRDSSSSAALPLNGFIGVWDSSALAFEYYVPVMSASSTTVLVARKPAAGTLLTATSPFTFATGDKVWVTLSYEAA